MEVGGGGDNLHISVTTLGKKCREGKLERRLGRRGGEGSKPWTPCLESLPLNDLYTRERSV